MVNKTGQDTVSASELKAHCAELIQRVSKKRQPILITRRGRPVARLVPVDETEARSVVGFAKGTVTIHGDIIEPIDVAWEAAE